MVKNSNIINFGIKKTVRDMDDWRLQNFIWYFERYNPVYGPKKIMADEIKNEAERRGITEGVLSIGD